MIRLQGSGGRACSTSTARATNKMCMKFTDIVTYCSALIAGQWREGLQHGHGVCEYAEGLRFEGAWVAGQRCGRGTLTAQGYKYDGDWAADRQHGQGQHTERDI